MNRISDQHIIDEFIAESLEHLNDIEPDLLAMEKGGKNVPMDAINRVFRAAHSIKGASGFHGFRAITELSHTMEEVLNLFRKEKIDPAPETIDTLLAGMDKLRAMLDAPQACETIACECELSDLKGILCQFQSLPKGAEEEPVDSGEPPHKGDPSAQEEKDPKPKTQQGASVSAPSGQSDPIHDAGDMVKVRASNPISEEDVCIVLERDKIDSVASNMDVYMLWVDGQKDLEKKSRAARDLLGLVETYGQCLAETMEGEDGNPAGLGTGTQNVGVALFASIMEPELMGHALDIPPAQITRVPRDSVETVEPKPEHPTSDKTSTDSPHDHDMIPGPPSPPVTRRQETIRINVDLIDKLMNLAGELVLGRNQLRQLLEDYVYKDPTLGSVFQNVDVVTTEVQESIMMMRLQPASKLFNRFPRMVRDLSRQLNKEANLGIQGAEVELDKSILESLSDPMTHIIRNCLDHAIESPEKRKSLGKSSAGRIHIKAMQEGGQVIITVEDDGAGIDVDKVVDKALSQGVITSDNIERMTRGEKLGLIFSPGLTTTTAVTEVSGRGVGMDVVKSNIENIGGHVEIDSRKGLGTTISIRLPLTLAIIPSLIVGAGDFRFAIPQVKVRELVCVSSQDVSRKMEMFGDTYLLRLRGKLLPIVSLPKALNMEKTWIHPETGKEAPERRRPWGKPSHLDVAEQDGDTRADGGAEKRNEIWNERRNHSQNDINIVVLRVGPYRMGLVVDALFDTQEIVVKPLSNHVKDSQCFAGATIMGDGSVAMILDPAGIADFVGLRFSEIQAEYRRRKNEEGQDTNETPENRESYILFNNAPEECFAVPLQNIARLSVADPQAVQRVGDREFITYGGKGLPLIYLDQLLPVRPFHGNGEEIFFIIPKNQKASVGIVASNILDTVNGSVAIEKDSATPQGFSGSAVVDGQLTMFLDINAIMDLYEKNGIASEADESAPESNSPSHGGHRP